METRYADAADAGCAPGVVTGITRSTNGSSAPPSSSRFTKGAGSDTQECCAETSVTRARCSLRWENNRSIANTPFIMKLYSWHNKDLCACLAAP